MSENPELAYARAQHQSGNVAAAGAIYRKILEKDPGCADAWGLLGVALFQANDRERAVESLRRAIELKPRKAAFHANLSTVLHACGDLEGAERSCLAALRLDPDEPKALNNYGGILMQQGRLVEAEGPLHRAARLKPDYADGLLNLGRLLCMQGKLEEARVTLEKALLLAPNDLDGRIDLGVALLGLRRFREALALFAAVAVVSPQNFRAHYYRGLCLLKGRDYQNAKACFEKALQIDPDQAQAHFGMGYANIKMRRWEEAEACLRTSHFLDPKNPLCTTELGMIEFYKGNFETGRELFEQALALDPRCAGAHFNLGNYRLFQGDLERGWREFLWFREIEELSPPHLKTSTWDGSAATDRTVVLRAEQGFGDTIQFARYAKMAKERAGEVVLQCPQELCRLMETAPGIDRILPQDEAIPQNALVVPVLNLPYVFNTTLQTIPKETPYLRGDFALPASVEESIRAASGRKIGLSWQGNPSHPDDTRRSLPAERLARLAGIPETSFFSLQKGFGMESLASLQEKLPVVDLGSQLGDFAETAAAIAKLDLVIAVDTATAHLAGALGKPVWLLLSYVGEWRWMHDRDDSPWYPSMRIFRQKTPGDWAGVVDSVRAALSSS